MQSQNNVKKIAFRGMLIALAMVLSWLESRIPVGALIPGMKLGLTNLVVMIALYRLNEADAIILNAVRIILVSMTFGNMFSLAFSMAGGILSGIVMILMKRSGRFSTMTVGVMGGIFHNVGQIIVAAIVMRTSAVFYYLCFLWFSGIAAGAVIGSLCARVVERLPRMDD